MGIFYTPTHIIFPTRNPLLLFLSPRSVPSHHQVSLRVVAPPATLLHSTVEKPPLAASTDLSSISAIFCKHPRDQAADRDLVSSSFYCGNTFSCESGEIDIYILQKKSRNIIYKEWKRLQGDVPALGRCSVVHFIFRWQGNQTALHSPGKPSTATIWKCIYWYICIYLAPASSSWQSQAL